MIMQKQCWQRIKSL